MRGPLYGHVTSTVLKVGRLEQQEDVDIMIHNVYYTITHGSLMLFPEVS